MPAISDQRYIADQTFTELAGQVTPLAFRYSNNGLTSTGGIPIMGRGSAKSLITGGLGRGGRHGPETREIRKINVIEVSFQWLASVARPAWWPASVASTA